MNRRALLALPLALAGCGNDQDMRLGLGSGIGGVASARGQRGTMTPAELVSVVALTAAAYGVTIGGFWVADLGVSQADASGRMSAWAPQLGTMPAYAQVTPSLQPAVTAANPDFGGRASIDGNGTRWAVSPYNAPTPSSQNWHSLSVCHLNVATQNKTFGQAGANRFGARCGGKVSTCELPNTSGSITSQVDIYERRSFVLEELMTGSSADKLRIGPAQNVSTGTAGNQDPTAGIGLLASNTGSNAIDGSICIKLVVFGTMPAAAVAAFERIFADYCTDIIIQTRRVLRCAALGDSLTIGHVATNDDGWRLDVTTDAFAKGIPLDFFGTTTSGTFFDDEHSAVSGSFIDDPGNPFGNNSPVSTVIANNFAAGKQFNGWADVVYLLTGSANVLNNESGASAAARYRNLLDTIMAAIPALRGIVVAAPPPLPGDPQNLVDYGNALKGSGGAWDSFQAAYPAVAMARVDLFTAMGSAYNQALYGAGNNVHPNDAGHRQCGAAYISGSTSMLRTLSTW